MTPKQIVGASTEDFVDEMSTGLTYKYGNQFFKPLKDSIRSDSQDDSIVNEALESAINTLQFATMNAVINVVQEYILVKVFASSGTIYAFIKGTSIVSKLKHSTQKVFNAVGSMGGAVGKFISRSMGVLVGSQDERLKLAEMANQNVNTIATALTQERQNQTMIRNSKVQHFDSMLNSTQKAKFVNDERKINLFVHKMKTGSWKNTTEDKKLYQDSTGFIFGGTLAWNKNFVNKINQFKEYATDLEGNIINAVQADIDYVTAVGMTKAK